MTEKFDKQAEGYDRQWARLAPLHGALHLMMGALLSELPDNARILVVGAGTGAEILYLAGRFPRWRFVAVEPSGAMLEVFRRRAAESGILDRCTTYNGYVESLAIEEPFDAATSILVSHFVLDPDARRGYFRAIGERLRPGGLLVSADLAVDTSSREYGRLLDVWLRIMLEGDVPPEAIERTMAAYRSDVALVPADNVAAIIGSAGFAEPVHFYQAMLIHAWFARWSSPNDIHP